MSDKLLVCYDNLKAIVGGEGSTKIFGVDYIKTRSDKSFRSHRCYLKVRKHLKGGKPSYDAKDHNLFRVWIPEADRRDNDPTNGYRSVPVEGLLEVRARGKTYRVEDGYFVEVDA